MTAAAAWLLAAATLGSWNSSRLSLLDVPFISQSEALCGGAAAAMVLRYWGAAGVAAEDFAALVDRSAGGIRTNELVRAVEARGWRAAALSGTAAFARAELERGRPLIALIEDRPGTFHYVVIVGWHERAVVVHDPARTPYALMRPADFERRWKVTASWMMVVTPISNSQPPTANAPLPTATSRRPTAIGQGCDALVAEGVRAAQANDLPQAERNLVTAVYQCTSAAPFRELAGVRLLQRRWPEVRELAGRAVEIDRDDTHSWRLLAASRYIAGDHAGALDAWNRAGEPMLDLVTVSGLQRTRHRVVERLLGLQTETVLTSRAMKRAGRRLSELPAAWSTRVEYLTRSSGRAEFRAHVAERPVVPRGVIAWTVVGLQAAVTQEAAVGVASATAGGERLTARWRFWPHRPAYGASLSAPLPSGAIVTVAGSTERQPFNIADTPAADRASARVSLGDWATGALRWEVRGGLDRWSQLPLAAVAASPEEAGRSRNGRAVDRGTFGVFGAALRLDAERAEMAFGGDIWAGKGRFASGYVRSDWQSSTERTGVVLAVRAGVEAVHSGTPLDLWPAGDTGRTRPVLLRAHPVIDDGRLRVERLGRQVMYAGAEARRWWRPIGPVGVGAAAFVDAGRTAGRPPWGVALLRTSRSPDAVTDVDAGLGLRFALPGAAGVFRLDAATGFRDGRKALSVAWEP